MNMNRKQFIESQGATCRNWNWSWSFINASEQTIIFGAWDNHTSGDASIILSEDWMVSDKEKKLPGFPQSREHIRLIEEEGYILKTFPIKYSGANKDENGIGPSKIGGFTPELSIRKLKKIGKNWYAFDNALPNLISEEVDHPEHYVEGASRTISVNTYERNSDARIKCIEHYGYQCAVCSFDFEKIYGSIGEKYIHVHHKIPLGEIKQEYKLNPIEDLIPVCPNCHAMIHRTKPALTIDQLKEYLKK
jgi:5-methylcytosine-specific restriction protein A